MLKRAPLIQSVHSAYLSTDCKVFLFTSVINMKPDGGWGLIQGTALQWPACNPSSLEQTIRGEEKMRGCTGLLEKGCCQGFITLFCFTQSAEEVPDDSEVTACLWEEASHLCFTGRAIDLCWATLCCVRHQSENNICIHSVFQRPVMLFHLLGVLTPVKRKKEPRHPDVHRYTLSVRVREEDGGAL